MMTCLCVWSQAGQGSEQEVSLCLTGGWTMGSLGFLPTQTILWLCGKNPVSSRCSHWTNLFQLCKQMPVREACAYYHLCKPITVSCLLKAFHFHFVKPDYELHCGNNLSHLPFYARLLSCRVPLLQRKAEGDGLVQPEEGNGETSVRSEVLEST